MKANPEYLPFTPSMQATFDAQMPPYQRVRSIVSQLSERHNQLKLQPVKVGGGVLHVFNSGLVLPSASSEQLVAEDAQLEHIVSHAGTVAYADGVALFPYGNEGEGEAVLYSLHKHFESLVDVHTEALQPILDQVLASGHRYSQIDSTTYSPIDDYPGMHRRFVDEVMLLATPDTTMNLEYGHSTKTKELVRFEGSAIAHLAPRYFYRSEPEGISVSPELNVPVEIPADFPQFLPKTTSLPPREVAQVQVDAAGVLYLTNDQLRRRRQDHLNPRISTQHFLQLVDIDQVCSWDNITPEILASHKDRIGKIMGGTAFRGAQHYPELRTEMQAELPTAALQYRDHGCEAVTARLRTWPRMPFELVTD